MATSLSNETSCASQVELSYSHQFSGSQISQSSTQHASSKASSAQHKTDSQTNSQSTTQSSQAQSSSNQGVSSTSTKAKTQDHSYSISGYSQQSSNAGLANYQFMYPSPYFSSFAQTTNQPTYNYQSASSQNNLQSNQTASTVQTIRRGNKKKVPAAQILNPETRLFFNLRRRDAQTQSNRGSSSHFYKPKNPPNLIEWFKKLNLEERVNALSTVTPHLTEIFIIMHQRIDQKGPSTFALRERNYQEQKYYQSQSYMLPYSSFPQILTQSQHGDSANTSFEESFYQRLQNETELYTLRCNEKEKIDAEIVSFDIQLEQEIMKQVRLTHYFDSLDTLTVTEELVQDPDNFISLMAKATNNQAFSYQCQFVFDQKIQQNVIEYPHWFKPKSFHSFATWVIVSLEENLWAHYNYDINLNLGTAKVNELVTLYRDKSDRGTQDVDLKDLSKFWGDTSDSDKKALIGQLYAAAVKEIEQQEASIYQSGGGYHTKTNKSVQSKNIHYSLQIKERKEEKSNAQIQAESELRYYVDQSQRTDFEQDFINELAFTKFGNTHQRQVLICKTFLDIIKKKYKDDMMENLLLEESAQQNKYDYIFLFFRPAGTGQTKKKKKKANNASNLDKSEASISQAQLELQDSLPIKLKPQKVQKPKLESNMSSNDTLNTSVGQQSVTMKKKKKQTQNKKAKADANKTQDSLNLHQDSYSCDEQDTKRTGPELDLQSEIQSSSQGISASNIYDNTTANQSNNISNNNSQETLASSSTPNQAANLLQIQSSKSLDLNPVSKSKSYSNTNSKQNKPNSKYESKNYQILQASSSNNDNQRFKTDKKTKTSTNANTYSDNVIFSEDDKTSCRIKEPLNYSESEGESLEIIKLYVLELTNAMINEVCKRVESSSPDRNVDNENPNDDLYQLGALPQSQYNHKKKQFYKKHKKDEMEELAIQQENVSQKQSTKASEKRKISFNNSRKSFKNDKKYSEDFAENISNSSQVYGEAYSANQQVSKTEQHYLAGERKQSQIDSQSTTSSNQRKGFGVHLNTKKTQAPKPQQDQPQSWVKGVTKQQDAIAQKQKVQPNKKQNQTKPLNPQKKQTDNPIKTANETSLDVSTISEKDEQSSTTTTQQAKKKRNRKKPKLNEVDIMNNFMKNLQTSHEEVKHNIEPKATNQPHGYKKRNSHHQQVPQGQSYHRDSKVSANEETKQAKGQSNQNQNQHYKQKQVKNQTATIKENQMEPNSQQHKPQNNLKAPNHPSTKNSFDVIEDEKNPEIKSQHKPHKHHENRPINKNSQKTQNQRSRRPTNDSSQVQAQIEVINDVNDPMIEGYRNKNSLSLKEQVHGQDQVPQIQSTKVAPFRMLQFTQPNDWDNNSLTDLTGTTNTAADTSLEAYPNHIEESKEAIIIEDQSNHNHIQVSLTDSIDAKNLLKNNALALSLQQFSSKLIHHTMSSTLQDIQESTMVPPQIQSPCSNLSATAQIYTPQGYNYQTMQMVHAQNYTNVAGFDLNENCHQTGYQSYQNTPSKQSNSQINKNTFRVQGTQLFSQNSQSSQESNAGAHFRTPPQVSKKNPPSQQNNYSNNGTTGIQFKKSTSGGNNKQYQVKEYHQAPKPNPQFIPQMHQSQMMAEPQYIHSFHDPNQMYYHDQSMMMPPQNQMLDMFYPQRAQSQVFYDDKSLMNPQQQMFYPNQQIPLGQFGNGMVQPTDNQFNYKRPVQSPFYDQSQDLILQIFNSIKFNQQSLSPIPQVISSPPLVDAAILNGQIINPSIGLNMIDSKTQYSRENSFYEKLDQEIYDFKNQIQQNLDLLKPERDFVLQRIQSVCNEVFTGQVPRLELFGSLITGLALESSDMDIAVTGLYMEDRYSVILELNKLGNALQKWLVIETYKCIETASIPVIKLKIDILKLRDLEMASFTTQENFDSRPVSDEARFLSVDITFDDSNSGEQQPYMSPNMFYQELMGQSSMTKTHLGLQSCALVQYYIANYPNLREVSILLKKFLALHNFNAPYYAYMNYFDVRANMSLTPSRLLMGFLDFYSNYFDPSSLGINVYNDGSFYQLNSLPDSNIVILDPLNLQNNTTRNSYLTKEILQKFQCAFNSLKSLTLKNPLLLNAGLSSETSALEKANSQDQNSSITFEKTSPRVASDNVFAHKDLLPDKLQHQVQEPEEIEASSLAQRNKSIELQNELPFAKVHLLEIFFAGVAQPVAASSGDSASQQELIKVQSQSLGQASNEGHESNACSQGLKLTA